MHEELVGLLPEEVSRRGFIAGSLAAGFALAVQPIAAQTVITTDTQGLEAGDVKIPVRDGEMPGYRAMPAKGKVVCCCFDRPGRHHCRRPKGRSRPGRGPTRW